MFYEDLYDRTYQVGEGKHYVKTDLDEECAKARWKQEHVAKGWSTIGRFDMKGEVPRAYVLPKSKDLRKGRPIVPYWKHCLRSVYRMAGRALSYILAGHEAKGFNICRTDDYAIEVKTKQKAAIDCFGENLRW